MCVNNFPTGKFPIFNRVLFKIHGKDGFRANGALKRLTAKIALGELTALPETLCWLKAGPNYGKYLGLATSKGLQNILNIR